MKEAEDPQSLARHQLELEAELCASTRTRETVTIKRQLHALRTRLQEHNRLVEALPLLPDFWQDIYGPTPGFLALFSGLRRRPDARLEQIREVFVAWPIEATSALSWIASEAGDDRELYQCGHLVTARRRRSEAAAPVSSLYADLDGGQPAVLSVEPSILVESSPGHYQAYVRLTQALPPATAAHFNRRLAAAFGADPSGWDLTQLLRIPGTVNHKYEARQSVRLVENSGKVYTPDQLDEFLPHLPPLEQSRAPRTATAPPPGAGDHPPIPLTRSARALWDGADVRRTPASDVDRSRSLVRIARLLHEARVPREQIVASLAERDISLGWNKYSERKDAAEQYHRIVDLVERGVAGQLAQTRDTGRRVPSRRNPTQRPSR